MTMTVSVLINVKLGIWNHSVKDIYKDQKLSKLD